MTAREFRLWHLHAKPGDKLRYHHGLIAHDRGLALAVKTPFEERVDRLARGALEAQESGIVHLVQRRVNKDAVDYIAVRR